MKNLHKSFRKSTLRDDQGQGVLQFVGLVPVVLAVGLLCIQAFITVAAVERVHNAARNAARVASMESYGEGQNTGWNSLPAWLIEESKVPACEPGQAPGDGGCRPVCEDGETPATDNCLPQERCAKDGYEEPWEQTCVDVYASDNGGIVGWVKTEIPVLFPGSPLVIPISQSVTMPGDSLTFTPSFAPAGIGNEANRQLGKKMAAQLMGWTGQEWTCLDQLWRHESGWRTDADNPTSTAYGIPQALVGEHDDLPADYVTNPESQIRWGLNYIADRPDYGTPCAAWAKWQARSPHWY